MMMMMMKEEENSIQTQEGSGNIMETDTSQAYEEIFGSTAESGFDSWEEFTTLMEEFQKKTGSSFKLKSASCVDYINEKRVHDQIPDRFVYAKVKMICIHFGLPTIKGTGHRKNYVGKGCGAFLNVGFNKGALRINQTHLVHTNHPLGQEGGNLPLRQFRVFTFTDELDLIISREVMKQNPFEFINGDKKWLLAIENLKNSDERLSSITPRLVKKRIRLLIDKFLAYSNGRPPIKEDELGNILYQFDKTRKETLENTTGRGRGRVARRRNNTSYTEDIEDVLDEEYIENSSVNEVDRKRVASSHTTPTPGRRRRGRPSKKRTLSPDCVIPVNNEDVDSSAHKRGKTQNSTPDVNSLVRYLQQKDEQDRKLRQQEIDLRREELTLLKREMDLQKQRLEIDQTERKALLDYLHAQTQAFQSSMLTNSKQHTYMSGATGTMNESTNLVDKNRHSPPPPPPPPSVFQ